MRQLIEYINEGLIFEGGQSGHMAHPIDYTDFTRDDLKSLVTKLFSGEIKDITEKVDGMNIQASVNSKGQVIFIRNKSQLNSENGGMTLTELKNKWPKQSYVHKTYAEAGDIINKVFKKLPNSFFNPDDNTRRVVNCECIRAGKTNIIPYVSSQVDYHNIWIYKKQDNNEWEKIDVTNKGLDELNNVSKGFGAQITPQIIISTTTQSQALADKYNKMIDRIFKHNININQWKYVRYNDAVKDTWIDSSVEGKKILFNRWFNGDKSINLRNIRQMYPNHQNEIEETKKNSTYKELMDKVMEPLDTLFLQLGNDIITMCKGLINQTDHDMVVKTLASDMSDVVRDIRAEGTVLTKKKLNKQLSRLEKLGNKINYTEGIVFKYKGRMMKLTGSFAPLNQILGSLKFSTEK